MQSVTVKDIAERIQRRGEPLQAAVDRLRNWTKEGIIKPEGEKNPGKGRSRQYGQRALFEAAFVQALVEAGLTATNAGILLEEITPDLSPKVWAAKFKDLIFVFGRSLDATKDGFYRIGPKRLLLKAIDADGPQDFHLIVNLGRIYQHAYPEK